MKKFFSLLLCLSLIALALPTFAEEAAPETITISTLNGNRETMELAVPYDPQRIAVLDMASLAITASRSASLMVHRVAISSLVT